MIAAVAAVAIHSCTYWRVYSSGGRAEGYRQLGVRIDYENVTNQPLTGVQFFIKTDIHDEYVTDTGLFSPSVRIVHQFYTTFHPYYDAKNKPDACRVVKVRFVNSPWRS